jgi:hypothetical protein
VWAGTVVVPVISLLVWLTVGEQGVPLPYDRSQFVTYYVLLSVVSMLTATWLVGYVAETIRLGGLSPWLLRPAPYITHSNGAVPRHLLAIERQDLLSGLARRDAEVRIGVVLGPRYRRSSPVKPVTAAAGVGSTTANSSG